MKKGIGTSELKYAIVRNILQGQLNFARFIQLFIVDSMSS